MYLTSLVMRAYGSCTDTEVALGEGVTVVFGGNESGKSTALDALTDLLWGVPTRTTRAYVHARPALRIDATVRDDGGDRLVVRKSTGLLEADLVTSTPCPWDPHGNGSAEWWRSRLGLDLAGLRAGGREVFTGGGDLAEIVFAAREGRSARQLLQALSERSEELFRAHRGNKNVRLRAAYTKYDSASKVRDAAVVRSDDVARQERLVHGLEQEKAQAEARETDAQRRISAAQEAQRVIEDVLRLRQARDELGAIRHLGAMLSPGDLGDLQEVTQAARAAQRELAKLDERIARVESEIASLSIDEQLIADAAVVKQLNSSFSARANDLGRIETELSPSVARESQGIVDLLSELGFDLAPGGSLDAAVRLLRVDAPTREELHALAGRLSEAEANLARAISSRDQSLASAHAQGLAINPSTDSAPRKDQFESLLRDMIAAEQELATATTVHAQAAKQLDGMREAGPAHPAPAQVTALDVAQARRDRDSAWSQVRGSWIRGTFPDDQERHDLASRIDQAITAADDAADQESAERARLSGHDARLAAHDEGLVKAGTALQEAESSLIEARAALDLVLAAWSTAWAELRVLEAPTAVAAPGLLAAITKAFEQHAIANACQATVTQLAEQWHSAISRAGLPKDTTPEGWAARVKRLDAIAEHARARDEAQQREDRLRGAWQSFASEAIALLVRHGEWAGQGNATPQAIEQGLARLEDRREKTEQDAARLADLTRDRSKAIEDRSEYLQAQATATALRERLASDYGTDPEGGLDALTERAVQAADPLTREAEAQLRIQSGCDPGSSADAVIGRLAGDDVVSVADELKRAGEQLTDAREAVDVVNEKRGEARKVLEQMRNAGSAADAEATVADLAVNLAQLAEEWSIVTLQVLLLEQALAEVETDETRPLLDSAGRILERITDGRYLALRAEETPTSKLLQVIRADGTRLGVSELSEGTADQVYFALRMAAVAELHADRIASGLPALPLVLDDVLMAFDDTRALEALQVLHDLAGGLQIIVFTHQQSVADAAARLGGIALSALPGPTAIDDPLDGELVRASAQQEGSHKASGIPTRAVDREPTAGREELADVRAWAQERGIHVGARGRVKPEIIEAYRRAHR